MEGNGRRTATTSVHRDHPDGLQEPGHDDAAYIPSPIEQLGLRGKVTFRGSIAGMITGSIVAM